MPPNHASDYVKRMVALIVQLAVVSIRNSRPTIRCSRLATAAIFNYTLLAKVLGSGSNLARPQAAKLRRWAEVEREFGSIGRSGQSCHIR